MPSIHPDDFYFLAPEIALTVWGLVVLTVDFTLLRRRDADRRQVLLGGLTLIGTLATLGLIAALTPLYYPGLPWEVTKRSYSADPSIFYGVVSGDVLTYWMNLVIVLMLAMVVAMSMAWRFTRHWGEYFALLLWAGVGMMFLVAAEELLTLFLTLETMTLCLYLA